MRLLSIIDLKWFFVSLGWFRRLPGADSGCHTSMLAHGPSPFATLVPADLRSNARQVCFQVRSQVLRQENIPPLQLLRTSVVWKSALPPQRIGTTLSHLEGCMSRSNFRNTWAKVMYSSAQARLLHAVSHYPMISGQNNRLETETAARPLGEVDKPLLKTCAVRAQPSFWLEGVRV